jgi:pyridoxal phosphate enzyme (YggS family)
MNNIENNIQSVRSKIEAAAKAAGRDPSSVKLIAVSKTKSLDDVQAALIAGQMRFGENRVQEAKGKFAALRDSYSDLELHLIGPLQTNKAEEAVRLFDVIETLDRPKLADAMASAVKKVDRAPVFYIEVNIGNEPQKAGIAPDEVGEFLDYCRSKCGLNVIGLMCIPPQHDDPEHHFKRMAALAIKHKLAHLSMGMSSDYEIAIKCGATDVRVGTAIFGARNYA